MNKRFKPLALVAAWMFSAMFPYGASASIARIHDNPQAGTVISYAAEPGELAYDGPDGGHSPFAEALLRYIEAPLDVGLMLRWVRDAVLQSTSGKQKPVADVDLPGRSVYLAPDQSWYPFAHEPGEGAEHEEAPLSHVALVVGISAYKESNALKTPLHDAAAIGAALERLGFLVVRLKDADRAALVRALQEFGDMASSAEVAVVFFSGHGVVFAGDHYLAPSDAQLNDREDFGAAGIPLDVVKNAVEPASVLRLILIDVMFGDFGLGRNSDR